MGTTSRVTHASGKTLITYTVRAHQTRQKMGKKSTSAVEKTMPETKKERLLTLRNVPTLNPGVLIEATGKQIEMGDGHLFTFTRNQSEHIGTNGWSF